MRITKVYTRTGDKGTTSLADGSRVAKTDSRIEAYGTVDELNAVVGQSIVLAAVTAGVRDTCLGSSGARVATQATPSEKRLDAMTLAEILGLIQHDLFNIGADLATPFAQRFKGMVLVSDREPQALEHLMDLMSEGLPPLRDFVLPGGTALGASLHLARTVCRRAERRVVELAAHADINSHVLIYLNRLSDFFFVASRWVLAAQNQPEVTWSKHCGLGPLTPAQDKETK